jgi:hypothetical protein
MAPSQAARAAPVSTDGDPRIEQLGGPLDPEKYHFLGLDQARGRDFKGPLDARGRPMSVESFPSRAYASGEAERLYAKLPSLEWGEFSRLIGLGVPAPALVWPELPARATVVFDRKRTQFDFAEEVGDEAAISAFLFLARDEDGEPADLVAWAPRVNRLASWFGAVALLGAEDLSAPRLTKERALAVFETPLGWLRAGREGVVVIDPRGAAPPLRLAEPLVAESIVPLYWAESFGNQGIAMMLIADRSNDAAVAETAVQQIETATETLRSGGQAQWTAGFEAQLPKARAIRDRLKGQ